MYYTCPLFTLSLLQNVQVVNFCTLRKLSFKNLHVGIINDTNLFRLFNRLTQSCLTVLQ